MFQTSSSGGGPFEADSGPAIRKLSRHINLSRTDREALDKTLGLNRRTIRSGSDLIEAGDVPSEMHIILSGWAARYKRLPDGRRQIVAFYLPGDVCELNVFLMDRMDHSIHAIDTLRVAAISRSMFAGITRNYPAISHGLWWDGLVASSIQREWIVNLSRRSARARLAHLLCELFVRMGAAGLVDDDRCAFPLTQVDLGDACGMTSVHVNRTLQDLRADGLISLEKRILVVRRWEALRRDGGFDPAYLHFAPRKAPVDKADVVAAFEPVMAHPA